MKALESPPELPDLLKKKTKHRSTWARALCIAAAALCFIAGIAGWLIPVITGIPFYIAGLVFLGIASERARTWINNAERRLPERFRWQLRRALLKLPSGRFRSLLRHPEEEECREESGPRRD